MNVLVLAWEFPPRIIGGISRHVAELYPELVKLGYSIHLITVEASGSSEYEVVDGIEVHRVRVDAGADFFQWVTHMNESMIARAGLLTEKVCFQIVHAHDWLVGDAAIAISKQADLPIVATIHATEYGRCNGIHTDTQRHIHHQEVTLAKQANRVIVCTQYMSLELDRALGCPSEKVDVIYNGLNLQRVRRTLPADFDPEAFRLKYAEPDEQLVYFVGRLTYEKGIFVLLNAAPKVLAATGDRVKLAIIGSGDAHSILLQRQAWDLGVYHKVVFTGFMSDDDLTKFQRVADCAVFPSLYEPFGIVALESFAARVPVVVSNTCGLPEVVRNGVTGIVTTVNNPDSLAQGILSVLQQPDFRAQLLENAEKDLSDRFAWPQLACQTAAVYQKCLHPSRAESMVEILKLRGN